MLTATEARNEIMRSAPERTRIQALQASARRAEQEKKRRVLEETLVPTLMAKLEEEILQASREGKTLLQFSVGDGEQGRLLCDILMPRLMEAGFGVMDVGEMHPGTPGRWDGREGRSAYEEFRLNINW